ncbi:MFS family permease [Paraburkholderia sp. GAS199]|uniref:tricarballylate/proton symporter TcuC n=1 Tax=Paraburkholderia sp. GAS199 TaxID=3035126 RepID=UPI003D1AE106
MSESATAGHPSGKAIFRVVGGVFLEGYDFVVYGFYASSIAKAMFPSHDPFISLMMAFVTFGMGFLMRPIGALVLGSYMDTHGRRAGLLLSLGIMAVGVLLLALTPNYATIGLAAPVLVAVGRLLQGFSAGAELGGTSVYLSEIAPPGRRGFYVSWQPASQQLAVLLASALGVGLRFMLSDTQMDAWGWRIPFLIGCSIIPVIFSIRRSIEESHVFIAQRRQTTGELFRSLFEHRRLVLSAVVLVTLTSIMFYFITVYTPTFGRVELGLAPIDSFWVAVGVSIVTFIMIPLFAIVSDRVGRRPMLVCSSLVIGIVAYPAMLWLVSKPSFGSLMLVEVGFAFLYAAYQSSLVVTLTEMIPANVRGTGFSLAYSLSQAIFGGFTPVVCTMLIHLTGNKAIPGVWLGAGALLALCATFLVVPGKRAAAQKERAGLVTGYD